MESIILAGGFMFSLLLGLGAACASARWLRKRSREQQTFRPPQKRAPRRLRIVRLDRLKK